MTTSNIKTGTVLFSTDLKCYHVLVTVTEKNVSYKPQIQTEGIKANKNTIKVYTTSRKKAEGWIKEGSWIIQ